MLRLVRSFMHNSRVCSQSDARPQQYGRLLIFQKTQSVARPRQVPRQHRGVIVLRKNNHLLQLPPVFLRDGRS